MKPRPRSRSVVLIALVALAAMPAASSAAPILAPASSPVTAATAVPNLASLPATTCAEAVAGHPTCDLWAKAGTTDLPGQPNLPVWGFVAASGDPVVAPGGPNLIVNEGDEVTITLHNALPATVNGGNEALSLLLPEAPLVPDTTGAIQGGAATYTFTATRPGTAIYEAGATKNARHQVAMGLYGALIVRPPGLATATLTTALGTNADLLYTAAAAGVSGNAITVAYVDPGAAGAPLGVTVTGDAISVSLATDGSGLITSTASDVLAAVNASGDAAGLLTASLAGGSDGSGVVSAFPAAHLSGGRSSAYDTATEFDDEALLVLGEIDPVLNATADPSSFDMKGFKPTYWLINGRTYHDGGSIPSTDVIGAAQGDRVLLRYVNASLYEHSMSLLGTHQTVIANDALPLTYDYQAVAETVAAGATMDTIATVPAAAGAGVHFPLSDQGQHLDLAGSGWSGSATSPITAGGMMTFIQMPDTLELCAGPAVTAGSATPDATNGTTPVAVSATFMACTPSGGAAKTVTDVEYFMDTVGANGGGTAIPVGSPSGTVTAGVSVNPSSPVLAAGPHTIFIHARDNSGQWGGFDAETFFVDKIGPDSESLTLSPQPTNGTSAVAVSGTGNDLFNGGQNISAAEFRIDSTGASPTAMSVSTPGDPISEITGSIPQPAVNGLSQGLHTVYVRSRDSFNNWGAFASLPLTIDKTGPAAGNGTIGPSPNNGTISIDINSFQLQAETTFTDPVAGGVNSRIERAEGFLDTIGANGDGVVFLPTDGLFDTSTELGYIRFPLAQIGALSQGTHTFYSHARDAAGNWGPFTTAKLIVDKTGPAITAGPAVAGSTLTATATDSSLPGPTAASAIAAAEWFEGGDPGQGLATPLTASDGHFSSSSEAIRATLPTFATGSTHTISVRALDVAGNWGAVAKVTFTVGSNVIFANGFGAGNLNAWSSVSGGGAIAASTASKLHGADAYGFQVTLAGTARRYVADSSPALESQYSARFYFSPHGSLPGTSTPAILAARNAGGAVVARVQYGRASGVYRVRAGALTTSGWRNTGWYTITNAGHAVEIDWQAGSGSGSIKLFVDGSLKQTIGSLQNGSNRIDSVRLGAAASLGSAAAGTLYFDDFVSTRGGTIGP